MFELDEIFCSLTEEFTESLFLFSFFFCCLHLSEMVKMIVLWGHNIVNDQGVALAMIIHKGQRSGINCYTLRAKGVYV